MKAGKVIKYFTANDCRKVILRTPRWEDLDSSYRCFPLEKSGLILLKKSGKVGLLPSLIKKSNICLWASKYSSSIINEGCSVSW